MDAETMKWFGSLGVGGVLAAMMYFINRKDVASFIDALKRLISDAEDREARAEQDRRETRAVIQKATEVIAQNTEVQRGVVDAINRIAADGSRESPRQNHWKGRG